MKKNNLTLSVIVIAQITLFLFLRYYKISESLFFFNDIGRDYLVLQNWHDTGKPPLLGPQNSAMPFNQSALYFYLLYPFFLITNQSPLSSLHSLSLFYLASFLFGLFVLRHHPKMQKVLLVSFFLVTIHPQYIIQGRYVWNPSFATPPIICAIISLFLYLEHKKNNLLILLSLSIALAVSFTYSVIPFCLAICLLAFLSTTKKTKFLLSLAVSLGIFNLPTLAFEIRHKFTLTRALFTVTAPTQTNLSATEKLVSLSTHLFGLPSILPILVIVLIFIFLFFRKNYPPDPTSKIIPAAFLLTLFFNLLLPFAIQSHYIFAYTSLLFVFISLSPATTLILSTLLLSVFCLHPNRLGGYFQKAPRTYRQMLSCFSQLCLHEKQPLFVAVQSAYHPYHYGPEHRYLLKNAGCQVINIENSPNDANHMALIVDGGEYDPQNTRFYELDLFGPSIVHKTYPCLDNFKALILARQPSSTPE